MFTFAIVIKWVGLPLILNAIIINIVLFTSALHLAGQLFPHFSHLIAGVFPTLVWVQMDVPVAGVMGL